METLIVLLGTFLVSVVVMRVVKGGVDYALAGRMGMSAMLVLTAVGHVIFTKGMVLMVPDFLPFKTGWVYFTGLLELAAAAGLLWPRFQKMTAWLLVVFFVSIFPANIRAALEHVNLSTGNYDGPGPGYLWFRVPLQVLFIGWVYLWAIKSRKQTPPAKQPLA